MIQVVDIPFCNSPMALMDCGACGGFYAISETYRATCEKNAKSWMCPYCRSLWGYSHLKTEAQRLRDELATLKSARANLAREHDEEVRALNAKLSKLQRTLKAKDRKKDEPK